MNKKEKGNILIILLLVLVIALSMGLVIYWSKSQNNVKKQIIKEIEIDQEAQNQVVLLYSTPIKMNENTNFYMFGDEEEWNELTKNRDFYYVIIMNDEEEWIAYEIVVEKGKITWCEEIENE